MKNNSAILFGVITLLLLAIFIAIRYSRKPRTHWLEQYNERPRDPYTLFLAEKLLRDYYPDKDFFNVAADFPKQLKKQKYKNGNYIFLGQKYLVSEDGADSLLQFIEKGNTAIISTKTLPYHLLFKLFSGTGYCQEIDYIGEEAIFSKQVKVNLLHPSLSLDKALPLEIKGQKEGQILQHRWNYIPAQYFCSAGFKSSGVLDEDHVNFAYIPYGKGRVYFHTTPEVFTNYYVMKDEGKKYFDGIMAHLKEDNIYYDVSARYFKKTDDENNRRRSNQSNEGPLSYILSQPALAASWYTILGLGVLFLIFRSKRKQRVIPILDKKENTSLIFIQNISNLYFQQGNNKQIAEDKFSHFLEFVHTKYHLTIRKDGEFVKRLSQKSGFPEGKIKEMMILHENISATTFLSDATMTKFALLINQFYKNCK